MYINVVHFDLSGGQCAGKPLQVSQFEREQDEAHTTANVHRALWVQEVMCRPIPDVFLKSFSHCLIHSEEEEDEEEGETWVFFFVCVCAFVCVGDIRTGSQSHES